MRRIALILIAVLTSLYVNAQLEVKELKLGNGMTVLNDIQNDYPSFRNMTAYVANQRMSGYTNDPNADIARVLQGINAQDIVQFHQQHVAPNKNRVWIIIGDKKLTDMKALSRYGKIVELKKEDIYR